ncbi:SET DOMAIN GROUP 40 [Chlorella sorokiniana]|uniref:SET DOMAIN GROUP 40 n=1 Tax=Chlorella sorokiniana TaxID=3076 RepID=A0A2P6TZP1_CHLSO|nr:SET DOMAIN GROUP 40 [Chlorella sorokiniana]|eukprot:PRW59526.1 SET DOMAIN GROUP 40 [Chlorella sorokiniana]
MVHCLADAAVFLLHRTSHRLTNQVAATMLHIDLSQVNPWYPVADHAVANFQTGYYPVSALFFLLSLPLTVLLKSWASVATIQLCQGGVRPQPEGSAPAAWWQPLRGVRQGLAALRALRPQVAELWRRVFSVEFLLQLAVAAAVVPSSISAWGVATLPFALVLVLDLQAAAPAAVAEGLGGRQAAKRSRQLLRGLRWQLAIPFVGLLLGGRALEFAKASLLSAMPARFYTHLVEIPVGVLVGGTALQVWFALWRDVLPFAAYRHAVEQEGGGSAATEAAAQARFLHMASPELLEWCERGGVRAHGVIATIVEEGGRGLVAVDDLEPGTCLLRVPRRLLMSVESARRDPQLVAALQQHGQGLSSEQVLAAHLLHECSKGPTSFWHPYLRSLPRTYTTAMCFTEAEAAALQVPAAVAAVHAAAAAAAAQHAGALPLLRALGLGPNWRSRAAWLIGYKAGQQVFLCYGRHTNLDLLRHYGFVLSDNPHDVAALPPRLLPPAVQQQLAGSSSSSGIGGSGSAGALDAADGEAEGAETGALLHANGAPSWELLRALRLGSATSAERKTSAYLALADQPISTGSERAAFEGLRAACEAALAELPTTIEQDEREIEAAAGV